MAEFKLGTSSIFEIGDSLNVKLAENGITNQSELIIYLNDEEFRMVDEDLFYRNRKDNDEEFIPSDGEIIVNFGLIRILIKVKK